MTNRESVPLAPGHREQLNKALGTQSEHLTPEELVDLVEKKGLSEVLLFLLDQEMINVANVLGGADIVMDELRQQTGNLSEENIESATFLLEHYRYLIQMGSINAQALLRTVSSLGEKRSSKQPAEETSFSGKEEEYLQSINGSYQTVRDFLAHRSAYEEIYHTASQRVQEYLSAK